MANFDLSGYETVVSRIKRFYKDYPDGRIIPEIIRADENEALIKTTIYKSKEEMLEGASLAVGHAQEFRGKGSFANKEAWLENCFHGDTLLLCENGDWIKIKDIVKKKESFNLKLAQVDLETNLLSFAKPTAFIEQKNQELYLIHDSVTCQCVTPDHDIIVNNKKIKANEVLRNKVNNIKSDASVETKGLGWSEYKTRFIQWIIADGHFDHDIRIMFGFKKIKKFEKLKRIINKLGLEYTVNHGTNGVKSIYVKGVPFKDEIPNKRLEFHQAIRMSKQEAIWFLEEIKFTDGTKHATNGTFLRQIDQIYFENIKLLCVLNGYCVTAAGVYKKSDSSFPNAKTIYGMIFKRDHKRRRTHVLQLDGKHTVYCVTMPKGTVVTKFAGKITISGQCEQSSIGRSLANAGYSTTEKCSREEMVKVSRQQKEREELLDQLRQLVKDLNTEELKAEFLGDNGLKDLKEIADKSTPELTKLVDWFL